MFLFLILTTLVISGSKVRGIPQQYSEHNLIFPFLPAQDYNSLNHGYYTPYGPSPAEQELNNKVGRETGVPLEWEPTGIDAQQPPNDAVPEAPCDQPGSENMPLEVLCSLPPHKGTGYDDIFRYYYNPVVQQCIPFSYSGKGGNSRRMSS